jgi:BirA family transcriptional regulator, biotin operon repressor / biotin---[acetyl-CoA-carboxylase] ligase
MFELQIFDSLSSTQDEMRLRLERGDNIHGLVIRALEQTAGRGQRARDWQSSQGGSYQTVAVRSKDNKPFAAIAIAIGISEVLRQQGIQASIKWPNDIYLQNKKLAGILCEYIQGHLLIGVGVNVKNKIPEYAIGLYQFEVETVSNFVLEGIQKGQGLFHHPDLALVFTAYDVLSGKHISVKVGQEVKEGIARGIDSQGRLRLEQVQETILIHSGHIGIDFLALSL